MMSNIAKQYEVARTLCRLGITANYNGFHYTKYAVELASEDPTRLQLVTKWLYPDVATKFKTDSDHVRKNISKVCAIAWNKNPQLLSDMAMHEIKKKPGTNEFLAILAIYSVLSSCHINSC